nr:disaggregatase related repeat-containing protein [Methanomethylovorans hollandica]
MSSPIVHAETYSLVKQWGSTGNSTGQFNNPSAVTVDSYGNVYVADANNYRIQKFDNNGAFINSFETWYKSQFHIHPRGVAVDSSGYIYTSGCGGNGGIAGAAYGIRYGTVYHKYDNNGNLVSEVYPNGAMGFYYSVYLPWETAVDKFGNVYVSDVTNGYVDKFNNGICMSAFQNRSISGSDSKFSIDSLGNYYIIYGGFINKFDSNGNFITKIGSSGSGDGQIRDPVAVAVDDSGNIYVVDCQQKDYTLKEYYRIEVFDTNYKFITQWQLSSNFSNIYNSDIAVDSTGNVFVVESYNNRIYKYAPTNSVNPAANFTSNITEGYTPLSVKFTDTSTGSPTSWLWDFGDGNTSTEQNPTYTYYKSGNYTVTLTASNSEGTDSTSQTISVNDIDFKVNPQKIRISDKVEFNASQYISSTGGGITWDFGDGKTDLSNNPIVYHNYSEPGSYTAKITITDSKGNVATKSQFVNVTIPVVLVHGFMSSSETWVDMSSALQKNGFEVWNFDYGIYSTQNPQDIAPKLSDFIEGKRNDLTYNGQKYNGKIDIVCHSMGSIVSRLYMEHYQGGIHGKDVRQWIGIAPAHGGSAGADIYIPVGQVKSQILLNFMQATPPEYYAFYQQIGLAVNELKTDSNSVKSLASGSLSPTTKYRVLVGWNPTHSSQFGGNLLSATLAKNTSRPDPYYWTDSGDMIVATAQSYDQRIKNFEAFPINGNLGDSPAEEFDHIHIIKSPTVIQYVIDCLKDINKPSSNKLPPDNEVSFLTVVNRDIKGYIGTKAQQVTGYLGTKVQQIKFFVSGFFSMGSDSISNLRVESNSITIDQETSSSQEKVLSILLEWDEGDIAVNLMSPSGIEYSAESHPYNVWYLKEGKLLYYIITDPESGNWTVNLIPEEYPGHDMHYNLTYWVEDSNSGVLNGFPVANFSTNITTGYVPLTVQFTDLSENATSWKWDFGDGAASTEQDPLHIYTKEGNYTIVLNSSNSIGYSTKQTTIAVKSNSASTSTASYAPTYDNRLRSASPTSVLSTTTYLDIGRSSATVRDVMLFDLSSYKTTDTISKATLSLYWYYPAGATRTSDTVVEVYRPVEWDPKYVTWNSRASGVSWTTAGGSWYDKNAVSQGTTPYASITFPASTVPDNKYYDFDVTQLVQEYVSGKYKNTGFFLKAKTESGNYIAFYSAEASNTAVRPKLTVTSTSGSTAVDNLPVANAGADKTAMAGSTVIFNASASTDDKGIASYSWDFDLSNGITAEATTMTASHIYPVAGTYTATLTVIDTSGQVSTDTVQVTVSEMSVDNPPIANAGIDKTVTVGSSVTFDGSASTDDKGIASYSWDFDLSNGITTEATTMAASHIYASPGTYTVTLTVTDTAGHVATDTLQVVVSSATSTTTASYSPTYDNRLRSASPTSVLSTTTYLDIGRSSATVRDVMLFDLSSYKTTDTISKATLSLYWYYPAGSTRTSDTIVEVYRPVEWDPKYVTWNSRTSGTLWTTVGGNWYDKNAVSQGTTPYASATFAAGTIPDNKYYDFDVTQLVQEYVSGKYKNTGFFLKAKTESGNYIAFYSAEASNTAVRPKLTITSASGSTTVDNLPVANAGADKTATVGTSVTFDASASTDDKGIASYSWDFDLSNGITAEAATMIASKTYTATGTYTVTLTVTDTVGQKSTDTVQVVVSSASSPVSTVSYTPTYDNRLRSASPTSVLSTTTYLDIGRSSATVRDVMLFDLSSYKTTDTISKATLSLYWYYPVGTTRTSDTVVEVYRPVEWDPKYVTWNSRMSGVSWTTAGGSWYDKNAVSQGTTPYASVTFTGTKLPDNKYYDFDVTQLVQEYVSGKYKNTGFFLKARTESGNYIAFYSLESSNAAVRPKLTITS